MRVEDVRLDTDEVSWRYDTSGRNVLTPKVPQLLQVGYEATAAIWAGICQLEANTA